MADLGTGATIAFGTSSFAAEYTDIRWSGIARDDIETSHLLTTTARTFIPTDLYDPGTADLDIQFNPNTPPPFSGAAETVTLTTPVPSGGAAGATYAATGYVKNFDFGTPLENLMTGTVTVKFSGPITQADSA